MIFWTFAPLGVGKRWHCGTENLVGSRDEAERRHPGRPLCRVRVVSDVDGQRVVLVERMDE